MFFQKIGFFCAVAMMISTGANAGALDVQQRTVKVGSTNVEIGCIPIPGSKRQVGVLVLTRGGLFTPGIAGAWTLNCKTGVVGRPIGGVSEPTGNVIIGGLFGLAGAAVGSPRINVSSESFSNATTNNINRN